MSETDVLNSGLPVYRKSVSNQIRPDKRMKVILMVCGDLKIPTISGKLILFLLTKDNSYKRYFIE